MGHDHSKATCPISDTSGPAILAIIGSLKWHSVSMIVAGATALFSVLIPVFLIFRHACHFSNPAEQKQIIRIIFIVPSFAVISFLCVWQDGTTAPYIAPGRDIGEALPMAAFFLLMSTYVAPDERNRDDFFAEMTLRDKKGTAQGGGSLSWYRKLTFSVLQWVPISIILWIATAISQAVGTYCITSNSVHFAHMWISIIRTISNLLAISSILRFYGRSKSVLKPRGAFKQLICFKFIVVLNFLQTLIFSFLNSSGDLHATNYLTFNDLSNGLPALILCCEMALISPFFIMAYSVKLYTLGRMSSPKNPSSRHNMQHYQGGPLGFCAILQAINVFDILIELLKGAKAKLHGKSSQSQNQYIQPGQARTGYVTVGKRESEDTAYMGPDPVTRL